MTPAESLPPLDAGYYLGLHLGSNVYRLYTLTAHAAWWHGSEHLISDPRLSGWTLTPVAAIEKLTEERDRLAAERDAVRLLFCAATRTIDYDRWVASIGERNALEQDRDRALADLVAVRAELARLGGDVIAAASELRVPIPTPGTVESRMLIANSLMRGERDAARAELARVRGALGDDQAGRPFAELLSVAADLLCAAGGGPLADCLRSKSYEVTAALSTPPTGSAS